MRFAWIVISAVLGSVLGDASQAQDLRRNLAVQTAPIQASRKEQRVALVIGNNAYRDAPLINPVNDARGMASALTAAGFAVTLRTDVSHKEFLAAVREFGDRLRQGGIGIFFYAGHGMQIKGRNYLIPVGAAIEREDEVAYAAVDAQSILDKMEAAGNSTNLMILDACRNNPFARSFRSGTQGLAQMDAPVGTLVAFATSPGAVASDGQGSNGLYTEHLLTALRQPGLKVEDVFKQTRAAVRRDSQGKQIPWEATSLEGDFYFHAPAAMTSTGGTAGGLEEAWWDAVKRSADPVELKTYLNRYPGGRYSAQARERLALLEPARPTPVAVAPTDKVEGFATTNGGDPRRDSADAERAAARDERTAELLAALRPSQQHVISGQSVSAEVPADRPPASASPDEARQREIDRRTAEILASLQAPAGNSKSSTVHSQQIPLAAASPSSKGSAAGDRWNLQIVDTWKGAVLGNAAVRVTGVRPDGTAIFADDYSVVEPYLQVLRKLLGTNEGPYSVRNQGPYWWSDMNVGDKRQVKLQTRKRLSDSSIASFSGEADLRYVARERVRVPAGDFDAIRLESNGSGEFIGASGKPVIQRWHAVYWYAPAIRYFAAVDIENRFNGLLDTKQRSELTSFEVNGGPVATR